MQPQETRWARNTDPVYPYVAHQDECHSVVSPAARQRSSAPAQGLPPLSLAQRCADFAKVWEPLQISWRKHYDIKAHHTSKKTSTLASLGGVRNSIRSQLFPPPPA